MFSKDYLSGVFNQALEFSDYLATGTDRQAQSWRSVYDAVGLNDDQGALLKDFTRQMNVLVVSGIWCGDCVEQVPLIEHIGKGSDCINLRYLDRDQVPDLRDMIMINAGQRVPMVIFMAEDFEFCSLYGDRSLNRYRKLAKKSLGPSCSTGLFLPETQEMQTTLQDWLNEFERIQLMLRLHARLRQKHQD